MGQIGKKQQDDKFKPQFSSVHLLSHVRLFATPWIGAPQASRSITNSRSLPKLTSIESVMPSSHLILCCPLLLYTNILLNVNALNMPTKRPRLPHCICGLKSTSNIFIFILNIVKNKKYPKDLRWFLKFFLATHSILWACSVF